MVLLYNNTCVAFQIAVLLFAFLLGHISSNPIADSNPGTRVKRGIGFSLKASRIVGLKPLQRKDKISGTNGLNLLPNKENIQIIQSDGSLPGEGVKSKVSSDINTNDKLLQMIKDAIIESRQRLQGRDDIKRLKRPELDEINVAANILDMAMHCANKTSPTSQEKCALEIAEKAKRLLETEYFDETKEDVNAALRNKQEFGKKFGAYAVPDARNRLEIDDAPKYGANDVEKKTEHPTDLGSTDWMESLLRLLSSMGDMKNDVQNILNRTNFDKVEQIARHIIYDLKNPTTEKPTTRPETTPSSISGRTTTQLFKLEAFMMIKPVPSDENTIQFDNQPYILFPPKITGVNNRFADNVDSKHSESTSDKIEVEEGSSLRISLLDTPPVNRPLKDTTNMYGGTTRWLSTKEDTTPLIELTEGFITISPDLSRTHEPENTKTNINQNNQQDGVLKVPGIRTLRPSSETTISHISGITETTLESGINVRIQKDENTQDSLTDGTTEVISTDVSKQVQKKKGKQTRQNSESDISTSKDERTVYDIVSTNTPKSDSLDSVLNSAAVTHPLNTANIMTEAQSTKEEIKTINAEISSDNPLIIQTEKSSLMTVTNVEEAPFTPKNDITTVTKNPALRLDHSKKIKIKSGNVESGNEDKILDTRLRIIMDAPSNSSNDQLEEIIITHENGSKFVTRETVYLDGNKLDKVSSFSQNRQESPLDSGKDMHISPKKQYSNSDKTGISDGVLNNKSISVPKNKTMEANTLKNKSPSGTSHSGKEAKAHDKWFKSMTNVSKSYENDLKSILASLNSTDESPLNILSDITQTSFIIHKTTTPGVFIINKKFIHINDPTKFHFRELTATTKSSYTTDILTSDDSSVISSPVSNTAKWSRAFSKDIINKRFRPVQPTSKPEDTGRHWNVLPKENDEKYKFHDNSRRIKWRPNLSQTVIIDGNTYVMVATEEARSADEYDFDLK